VFLLEVSFIIKFLLEKGKMDFSNFEIEEKLAKLGKEAFGDDLRYSTCKSSIYDNPYSRTEINYSQAKYSSFLPEYENNNFNTTSSYWQKDNDYYSTSQKNRFNNYHNYHSEKEFFENLVELKNKTNKEREDQLLESNLIKKKKNRENYHNDLFKEDSFKFNLDSLDINGNNVDEDGKEESNMINLFIKMEDPFKLEFMILIHQNNKIALLKQTICDKLKDEDKNKKFKKLTLNSFILMKKYSIIKENTTIVEANIKDKDIIYILVKDNVCEQENNSKLRHSSAKKKNLKKLNPKSLEREESISSFRDFAPLEKIPILTKPGYKTFPDYKNFCRMSVEELQNVKDFEIYNDYGRIQFPGITNLENLNLDDIVQIEDKFVCLYQNKDVYKHEVGKGLNKEAFITMYNIKPKYKRKKESDEEYSDFIKLLKNQCHQKDTTFVKHDRISGEWIFKVNHS